MLEIRMLGTFDVRLNGEPVEIPSRPAQSLLAYLVLNPGNRYRREKLAGMLWPDSDEANARSYLRHALWRLRKALGEETFLADKVTIAFNANVDPTVDVFILDEEIREQVAPDSLITAVSAYGGELLPGFYDNWVVLERERLRATFDQKMQSLLDTLVGKERWTEVLEWGERWIALGHVPEPAYRALMIANGALGDSAGVAALYRRCCEALETELGVEPSEQTQRLYEQLSKGEFSPVTYKVATPAVETDASSAVKTLLQRWRDEGVETLDLASLAIVHASRREVTFDPEEVDLLIHSALHHEVDVEPWLRRARSPDLAVAALEKTYRAYPKPRVRMRIVDALARIEGNDALNALLDIVDQEDNADNRAEAAIIASRRGKHTQVITRLLEDVNERNDTAAFAAFVAVVDEIGLPEGIVAYPRLSTQLALLQRRWRDNRASIIRRVIRGAIGGAIGLAIHGSATPLYMFLSYPESIGEIMDVMSLPGWILAAAVLGIVIGGLQGAASTFFISLADALWKEEQRTYKRQIVGTLAGLVHSIYLLLFSFIGLFSPEAGPAIYVPTNLVYGLLVGFSLALTIPRLGEPAKIRNQIFSSLRASLFLGIVTIPYVFLIYQTEALASLLSRIVYAFLLPLGMGILLADRDRNRREY